MFCNGFALSTTKSALLPLASVPVSLIWKTSVGLEVDATIMSAGLNPYRAYIVISWCSAKPYEYLAETPASVLRTSRAPDSMYFGKLYLKISSRCALSGVEQGFDF